jgi:hypothetical protein
MWINVFFECNRSMLSNRFRDVRREHVGRAKLFNLDFVRIELLPRYVHQRTAFHLRKRLARTEAFAIVAFDNEVGEAFGTYLCHEL